MSLFTALINLFVVAGVGWFTIYYLIPKIESGEIPLPGFSKGIEPSGAAGSGGEVELALGEIMDAVNGDESGTATAEAEKKTTTSKTSSSSTTTKKGPSPIGAQADEWLAEEKKSSSSSKKKTSSKTEYRHVIEDYLGLGDYYYGFY